MIGDEDENGGIKLSHVIVKDNLVNTEVRERGSKVLKLLHPQPDPKHILTFHRYYSALKKNPNYKKRVTWIEGDHDSIKNHKSKCY